MTSHSQRVRELALVVRHLGHRSDVISPSSLYTALRLIACFQQVPVLLTDPDPALDLGRGDAGDGRPGDGDRWT